MDEDELQEEVREDEGGEDRSEPDSTASLNVQTGNISTSPVTREDIEAAYELISRRIREQEAQPDTVVLLPDTRDEDIEEAVDNLTERPLVFDSGSVSRPMFSFNGDSDTGLGRSSENVVSFGDGDTGLYNSSEDVISLAVRGNEVGSMAFNSTENQVTFAVLNEGSETFGVKPNGALMIRDQDTGDLVEFAYSSKKGGFITVKDNKLVEVVNEKEEKEVSKWEAIISEVNGWEDNVSDD